MDVGQRSRETRPDDARKARAVGEAQERGEDIAARQAGGNDGDNQSHGNVGDGREQADGKRGSAPGGDVVGATVAVASM